MPSRIQDEVAKPIVPKRTNKVDTFTESRSLSKSAQIKIVADNVGLGSSLARINSSSTLVALEDILPGEKIYAEKPFVVYPGESPEQLQIECIRSQIMSLTRNKLTALSIFQSLFKTSSLSNLGYLMETLSVPLGNQCRGIYVFLSKTRHSCSPNTEISMHGDVVIAHATRLIPKGTEITRTLIENLNMPFESRRTSFRSKFAVHCSCYICRLCSSNAEFCMNDDSLRVKINDLEVKFCNLVKDHPHEALLVADSLLSLLIKSAVSSKHFHYADMPLLRRLHLRMATICMQSGSSKVSFEHLRLATTYCALCLGWNSKETLKIMQTLEKRSIPLLGIAELPIFIVDPDETLLDSFLEEVVNHHRRYLNQALSDTSIDISPVPSRPPSAREIVEKGLHSKRNRVQSTLPEIKIPSPSLRIFSPPSSPVNEEAIYMKVSTLCNIRAASPKSPSRVPLIARSSLKEDTNSIASSLKIEKVHKISINMTQKSRDADLFDLRKDQLHPREKFDSNLHKNDKKIMATINLQLENEICTKRNSWPVRLSSSSSMNDDYDDAKSVGTQESPYSTSGATSVLLRKLRIGSEKIGVEPDHNLDILGSDDDDLSFSSDISEKYTAAIASKVKSRDSSNFSIWARLNTSNQRFKPKRKEKGSVQSVLSTTPSNSIDLAKSLIRINSLKIASPVLKQNGNDSPLESIKTLAI